jgi:hypothetical protein
LRDNLGRLARITRDQPRHRVDQHCLLSGYSGESTP